MATAVVVAAVVGLGLVAPPAAVAVPSSVVTSSEFFAVTQGNSIAYVRKVFGANGKVMYRNDPRGTVEDQLQLQFPTYYDDGFVEVEFRRRASGAWYLWSKVAYWYNWPVRTADKATESEFHRVGPGNTLGYVRGVMGSEGTITEYLDVPGSAGDRVRIGWPTDSVYGRVDVGFVKTAAGVWKATEREGFWYASPRQDAHRVTDAEFYRVQVGNTLDFARRTFGSAGTINAYDDRAGTAYDTLHVKWPVESPNGWVAIGFLRDRAGTWRVHERDASWSRVPEPTADLATQAELAVLQGAARRGEGVTLARARSVFGTPGTVMFHYISVSGPGFLSVGWYAGSDRNTVSVEFRKNSAGVWTATSEDDMSGTWP